MVVLSGDNLGKRQQDLNRQVQETIQSKADFTQIKNEPNLTDVDVLFKIDVASKLKDIDYILETLKSGDSLYISRALKCAWLYDNEFSNVINTDYLHHNIFPFMSSNMRRKLLTTLSIYLKDEDRAESFYKYCVSVKLRKIAMKFLIHTADNFKVKVVRQSFDDILQEEEDFFRHFVGNSFPVAEAIFQEAEDNPRSTIIYYLRYLISVSDYDYVNLMEHFDDYEFISKRFGLRTSKQILEKHKSLVLERPLLYVNRLSRSLITKYFNVDDIKHMLRKVMPGKCYTFWQKKYCKKYDFLINKIPPGERYQFVKQLFNEKYPNEEFEMSKRFLDSNCEWLMTVDEKEAWALRHLESNSEIQGLGRSFQWYAYINFEKAFPEIKKLILITPDLRSRCQIVDVLIKSVRNQRHMQTLLTYYYDRHVNEPYYYKEQFITSIIEAHNVFVFDKDCWNAFNKVLSSIKVYKTSDGCNNLVIMFTAIIYHIVNKLDLPEALKRYILGHHMDRRYNFDMLYKHLSKEVQQEIYEYISKIYVDEITKRLTEGQCDNIDDCIQLYVRYLEGTKKSSDDCPPIIIEYINDHWNIYKRYSLFKKICKEETILTESDLLRNLKKDSKSVVEKLPEVTESITGYNTTFKINTFLKKIKIYFHDDIAKEFYNYFTKTLAEANPASISGISRIVYGLLQLSDQKSNIDFVTKYAPAEAKINHENADEVILGIQESICRSICFTRPPIPLPNVLQYVRGDYLKFCLPMFQSYQEKLPQPLLQEFVISLIDAPVSVQKHALRLVFKCFSLDDLKTTVSNCWKRTKNVSLRFVLYQSLYNKLCDEDTEKDDLFHVLMKFTAELNEDDNIEIFDRYMSGHKIPERLLGSYIKVCWETVNKFPDKTENYQKQTRIIYNIIGRIGVLEADFVKGIVDDHVDFMLMKKNIRPQYDNDELDNLNNEKWKLVATYVIYFASDANYVNKNIDLVTLIWNKCIENWNLTHEDVFTCRQFCWNFLDELLTVSTDKCCSESIPIFECIKKILEDNFPLKQIYKALWSLRLTILRRKEKKAIKMKYHNLGHKNLVEMIRDSIYDFGRKVGEMVKECVDTNTYFITANNEVADMIKDNVDNIMSVNIENKCGPVMYEGMKSRNVLVAGGLTDIYLKETFLLALYILPYDSSDNQYNSIVDRIENFDCEEVQYCWFNKFVYNDYKRRKIA